MIDVKTPSGGLFPRPDYYEHKLVYQCWLLSQKQVEEISYPSEVLANLVNLGRREGAFPELSTTGYSQNASFCLYLAGNARICEQREDARVWGTQLESAWSTNSTATFAPELPTVQVSAYSM